MPEIKLNKKRTALFYALAFLFLSNCGSQGSLYPGRDSHAIDLSQTLPDAKTRLAILGDTQEGLLVFEDLGGKIAAMTPGPDVVIHLGDMIGNPGSGVEWEQFHQSAQIITDNFPFFPAPGNHDAIDPASQEIYRHQFQAPVSSLYYDVEMGDLLLIFLDTVLAGEVGLITNRQYDWLQDLLAQKGADFKYRLVFMHYPLFPSANHVGDSLDAWPEQRDRLHQLFVQHNVNLVFSGHEHIYDRKLVDGISYITSGGSGGQLYDDSRGFYHFVFLAQTEKGIQGYCFSIDGVVMDEFIVE